MVTHPIPIDAETDALCELTSIGAGNATTALSKLLGRHRIMLSVPEYRSEVHLMTADPADREGVGVRFAVKGGVHAVLLVWLDLGSARGVVQEMLGHESMASRMGDIATSALTEFGNIAACAFVDAVAQLIHDPVIPEPPDVLYGGFSEAVAAAAKGMRDSTATTTQFLAATLHMEGRMTFIFDRIAAVHMLDRMGVPTRRMG